MGNGSRSRFVRGFSLIEVMVVVGVVAIMVGIAVPTTNGILRQSEISSSVRGLTNDIALARASAARGKMTTGEPVRAAGVRLQSASTYSLFTDDSLEGQAATTEEVLKVVTIPSVSLLIVVPSTFPAEIVFRSRGTLESGSTTQIVLEDPATHRRYTLEVSMTGGVKAL